DRRVAPLTWLGLLRRAAAVDEIVDDGPGGADNGDDEARDGEGLEAIALIDAIEVALASGGVRIAWRQVGVRCTPVLGGRIAGPRGLADPPGDVVGAVVAVLRGEREPDATREAEGGDARAHPRTRRLGKPAEEGLAAAIVERRVGLHQRVGFVGDGRRRRLAGGRGEIDRSALSWLGEQLPADRRALLDRFELVRPGGKVQGPFEGRHSLLLTVDQDAVAAVRRGDVHLRDLL